LALDDQAAHTHEIIDEIGRNFGIVDAKLGNSTNTGNAALESLTVRLEDARDAIHKLSEPISGTEAALAAVENRLADVGSTAGTTLAMLDEALPAALPRLDAIAGELVLLHESASALAAPISSSDETIEAAQGRLEAARAALEGAATILGGQLEAARAAIAEIETLTGNASLTASTDLIDVFGRVRDVATQTAGTMRETLSGVITEAEAALDRAGSARAEAAFGAPIRAHIESLEAAHQRAAGAAQAAAERVAERLLSLTGTIAGVEARIDEVDTRFDIRERNTLARRSKLMLDSLQAAAIDLTRLLALDIEDSAWDEYLKGDKSIFARRISQRLDGETLRSINRHATHDAEFRIEAVRYVEEFEALIGHVMTDREGRSLAMTLLSSDTGKLYLALKEAVERAD
jgi:predicted  nucleic acid-binding Zn-ribbon protein